MRDLTAQAEANLAARGSRPIVLVTLSVRSATGGNATYRWASQGDGSGSYGYRVGGNDPIFRADVADPGRIRRSLPPAGGIAALSGDALALVNPDEAGALLSTLFNTYDLDEAEISIELVFADGSETDADRIVLARGVVDAPRVDVRRVVLPWRDVAERAYRRLLNGRIIAPKDYPFAPEENWGRIRPVILGDLRGQGFDVSTPANGTFPHVPAPAVNAQRQRFAVHDDAAGADRELLLELYGHLIQIPDASYSTGTGYVQIDDNLFWLWLRPHRIDLTTQGVVNPEDACTHDLDRAATVQAGTALFVHVPGANANLGQIGSGASLAADDVTVYVIYRKVNPADANPAQLTIRLAGVGIPGHTGVNLNGSGTAVEAQTIGDHLSGWDDLRRLSVIISGATGTSGVSVCRILMRVVFRCDEVRAAFAQQRLFRAQQGFIESATSPQEDYQDGGYLWGARTSEPISNPADVAEVLLRHRAWGLGMRAPSLEDTGAALAASVYADTTSWQVSDGSAFGAGDLLLADREVVRVESITGDALTVRRGVAGSRPTAHLNGTALFRFGSGGEVDSASFRGAAGILREPDGVELLTNGAMEGVYANGVAPGWTEYDPSSVGAPSAAAGYVGRFAQQIERTASGGTHPGILQGSIGVTPSEWYRLRLFARAPTGTTTIQCSIAQTSSLHPTFAVGTEWTEVIFDFEADSSSITLRLRNAGNAGDVVQFDAVSLQKLVPWRMDFALTEAADGRAWLDRRFLPQTGLRLFRGSDGRIKSSAVWPERPAAMTIDASRILVDEEGAPMLSLVRTPPDEVATGVVVRYAYNHLTRGYDGLVGVLAERETTGQTVQSVASGSPLDVLTVADSSALAPKDAADETAHITASGTTVTLPSGDLINAGVAAGDWLIVRTSYGAFLFQIASVTNATQVELVERPPQFDEPGQWSAGNNLYLAGNEIFGTHLAQTGTTITIFRAVDARNLTSIEAMQSGDVIWALASTSDDGTGARDEGCYVRNARERRAMFRIARHRLVRTLHFDAPYIRDRRTAVFLRNRLFDRHDRAWLIALTTDLSTLALEVGDVVTVQHELVPGGAMTGEIIRQTVEVNEGKIEYLIRTREG